MAKGLPADIQRDLEYMAYMNWLYDVRPPLLTYTGHLPKQWNGSGWTDVPRKGDPFILGFDHKGRQW